jgi:hypothetical protein
MIDVCHMRILLILTFFEYTSDSLTASVCPFSFVSALLLSS